MTRALSNVPGAVIGYRKDGAPIRLIAGGDPTGRPGDGDQGKPDHTRLTYKQAVNRLKDIHDEMKRIRGKENRTAEDDRQWTNYVDEAKALDEHIRNLKRDADEAAVQRAIDNGTTSPGDGHVDDPVGGGYDPYAEDRDRALNPDSVKHRRFRNPYDLSEVRGGLSPVERGAEFRARALSAIESKVFPAKSDKYREVCTRMIEQFDSDRGDLAFQLLATSDESYVRAFGKYVARNGQMAALDIDEQKTMARALQIGDIGTGGALLPFQLDPAVVLSADGSFNEVRRVARQVVAIADKWHAVTSGSPTSRWGAESTPATDGTPVFQRPTVDIQKLDIFIPTSIEAAMDLINIAQEVARLIAFEADRAESVAFVTGAGDGSDEPWGLITRLAAAGSPTVVPTTTAGSFLEPDVYEVDSLLPARYRFNASWLAHRRVYNAIRQFDEFGGSALWVQLGADVPPLLVGRRAYEAEAMSSDLSPALGVDSDILTFGDFEHFVIADRIGTTVEFIPHLVQQVVQGSGHAVPTGERGWYAFKRVGSDVLVDTAFRLLRLTGE